MTSEQSPREPCLAFLEDVCAEDVDFLTGHKPRFKSHNEGRKAKQLCRQVADTLDLVLSGDCRDERLQALRVISVVPAPHSSRLLVTVSADLPSGMLDRQEILELLGQQTGRLRAEVAASIHRKRVPALVFQVVGPSLEFSL
jgi:ribosome-binding factor A